MRLIPYVAALAVLPLPAVVFAQQITITGWVDSVDTANSTVTIRTLNNPRTVQVAPNAVIRVNGVVSRLDQLPANAEISIIAEKGPNDVVRATQITVGSSGAQPAAAVPPGSVVMGTLVGMNIPANTITVRTRSGDQAVPLGAAPIFINGRNGSTRDLRVGQIVRIERALPTEGSTDYVTQVIRVLPAGGRAGVGGATGARGATSATGATGGGAAGNLTGATGAGVVDRGTATSTQRAVRTRTRGYTGRYRSSRSGSRVSGRTSRARVSGRRTTRSGARYRTRSRSIYRRRR
jgi:hypothetical protein